MPSPIEYDHYREMWSDSFNPVPAHIADSDLRLWMCQRMVPLEISQVRCSPVAGLSLQPSAEGA